MKKLSRSLMACSVFVMLAVFMSSCKQDLTVQPTPSVSQATTDKIVDLTIQGVEVKNDVLYFKDAKSFKDAQEIFNNSNYDNSCLASIPRANIGASTSPMRWQ